MNIASIQQIAIVSSFEINMNNAFTKNTFSPKIYPTILS